MPTPSTSPIASAIAVEGLLIQLGDTGSPQVFNTIANVSDWAEPVISDTVDVTNVGDSWRRRIATLHDMGKIKFTVFWVMLDETHENAITGAIRGLRYMLINNILGSWKIVYPDGATSTDTFPAYVTSFSVTGKVGDVFKADVELSNDGAPTLV